MKTHYHHKILPFTRKGKREKRKREEREDGGDAAQDRGAVAAILRRRGHDAPRAIRG